MERSLGEVISKLENLFSVFNEHFYEGQLEKPVIMVSPDITSCGAFGWCTSWKAWKESDQAAEDEGFYEINLTAEYLKRPFDEICETLLHEMVHLFNLYADVQDTSRSGTYHNKRFKDEAEKRGLVITKSPKYGWALTSLNEEGKQMIGQLDADQFGFFRQPIPPTLKKKKGQGSSSRKYVCPGCGCIIRATKEVHVVCGDCDMDFEIQE